MRNQLLKDTDWASMANSIEVRVPFVDYDFLKSFKLSGLNIKDGKKNIFRKLFHIPKFILNKRKTGFNVPYKQIIDLYNKKYKTDYKNWSEICLKEYFKTLNIRNGL